MLVSTSGCLPKFEQSTVTGLLNPTMTGSIVTPTSGDQSHLDSSPGLRTGIRVVSVGRPADRLDRLDRGTVLIDKERVKKTHGAPDQAPAPAHALVRGWLRFGYEGFRGAHATAAESITPPMAVTASMMGRGAAELHFDRIDGERGPSRHVVSPTQLVARSSRELAP